MPLGSASQSGAGQVITFPTRSFTTLRITIDATNLNGAPKNVISAASPAGLAEVGVAGARAQQIISMPGDLLASAGTASQSHRLVILMTRERVARRSHPNKTPSRSWRAVLPAHRRGPSP